MATGRSLHIGLNSVDPGAYGGWSGKLTACEYDAHDMRDICAGRGFQTTEILTSQATADAVLGALDEAAAGLVEGDLFVVSYSGHGGQLPDTGGEEPDQLDETWVLFDRQLLDDELYARWATFAPGVRVVVLSDSCHSGSVVKAQLASVGNTGPLADVYADGRFMPWDDNVRDNIERQALYDSIRAATPGEGSAALAARVLLLSGCQDNQTSMDGPRNGAFTGTLREVWDDGRFRGGYRKFLGAIKGKLPPWQTPNYLALNDRGRTFDKMTPFTL
jgi:metacaspase-1